MPASDFTAAAYADRLARTRAAMAAAGIDTLIIADPSNMAWLTGYDGWSFYVPQAVILPSMGNPYWWGRPQDLAGAAQTTWLPRDRLLDWPEAHVQHPVHRSYEALVQHLRARDLTARIGVEMDNYYYSAQAHHILTTAFGLEASASHLTWNDRPLTAGEATYFEVSGCFHRYHCPACRTLYLGEPPANIRRAEAAVLQAIDDALTAARPGVSCEEVATCVYDSLVRAGFEKANRTGYPIGLSYPPDWGERTMSLRPGDTPPLQAGMCFHLMPGLWTPDWGVAITESFVVTDAGGVPLADIPREMHVVAGWHRHPKRSRRARSDTGSGQPATAGGGAGRFAKDGVVCCCLLLLLLPTKQLITPNRA